MGKPSLMPSVDLMKSLRSRVKSSRRASTTAQTRSAYGECSRAFVGPSKVSLQ